MSRISLLCLTLVLALASAADVASAQQNGAAPGSAPGNPQGSLAAPPEIHGEMLRVPVTTLTPGAISVRPKLNIPKLDAAAAQRGMQAFNAFNCVGCHMGNGGGGMGPALSNSNFIYGGEPENIYLTIVQGRPKGMPAWGAVLPDEVIWDLVAYVKSISSEPSSGTWGTTVAVSAPNAIQQVPAELQITSKPWDYTEKFTSGQKP